MRVLVAGANGRTGKHIVRFLLDKGYKVRALVRMQHDALPLEDLGAEGVLGDLLYDVTEVVEGCDAVVFAAGAGGGEDPERVDHEGAVKLIAAAKAQGARRFVLVSSVGTTTPETMPEMLRPYLVAKRKAEEALEESGLEYTIIRPGGLTDEDGKGSVKLGQSLGSGTIARADVAHVAAEALALGYTHGKAFDLLSGDTPIAEALQGLSG